MLLHRIRRCLFLSTVTPTDEIYIQQNQNISRIPDDFLNRRRLKPMRHAEAQTIRFDFISQGNIREVVPCKTIQIRIYGLRCIMSEAKFDSVIYIYICVCVVYSPFHIGL
jgi:hypothetical protein